MDKTQLNEVKTFLTQGYFTFLGIGGVEVNPIILYQAVKLSHEIDDYVDVTNPNFDTQFLEYYIQQFPSNEIHFYHSIYDIEWLKYANNFVLERVLTQEQQKILEKIRSITESLGQLNSFSYELSLMQMILAGFVQVSHDTQEDHLYDIYKRVIAFQTGEDINDLSRESLISRSSGLQIMFYSIFRKLETFLEIQLITNFDTILGPLVYLQNSLEESQTATFKDRYTVNREISYLKGIYNAQKRISELLSQSGNTALIDLYKQKRNQLNLAIQYILKQDNKGELFTDQFNNLRYVYSKLHDLLLL